MKRFTIIATIFLLILVLMSVSVPQQALAQSDAWAEVVDSNGVWNPTLIDHGEVTVPADWMPSIPFLGDIPASYHLYETTSGNLVMVPSVETLFFMAMNPQQSGLSGAQSQLGSGGMAATEIIGYAVGQGGPAAFNLLMAAAGLNYTDPQQFGQAVTSGEVNIWSLGGPFIFQMMQNLASLSWDDGNLYLGLLLFPPGMCASLPGGCPPGFPPTPPPPDATVTPPPAPVQCNPPQTTIGAISMTAIKMAPNHPIVVGQDPDKRGADLSYTVRVEPTIRRVWVAQAETECRPGPNQNGNYNCMLPGNQPGHERIIRWYCEERVEVYRESLTRVSTSASLAQSSRDWILNELSIRYPGAHLKRPSWAWGGNPGAGGFQGNTFVWNFSIPGVQFADPGYYGLGANGATSGTPITPPRTFNLTNGRLEVWLKETTIIK